MRRRLSTRLDPGFVARLSLNIALDGMLAAAAVAAAFWLATPQHPWPAPPTLPLAGAAAIWLIGVPFGLSRLHWRFISLRDLSRVGVAALLTALMLTLLLFGAGLALPSPGFPIILALCLIVLLTAPKLIYRLARQAPAPRAATAEQTALLVGNGESAELFLAAMARFAAAPYRVTGLLALSARHTGRRVHGLDVIGAAEQAGPVLARLAAAGRAPDLLIVATPEFAGDALAALLATAETYGVRVLRAPNLTNLAPANAAEKIALQPIAIEDLLNRRQVALDRGAMARLVTGRRVLVTGAGGSIGAELARQVAALRPAELLLLDNGEYALWQIDLELAELHPALPRRAVIADVRAAPRLAEICQDFRPELVFHAAALKHVPIVEANPLEGLQTNVLGTRAVADAARAAGAKLMVLISTDKAVNPSSVMGATKRLAEMYCQGLDVSARHDTAAMRCVTVRFGNVLGSTGSVVPLFRRQLAAGGPLTVTHPDMQRYFMTVGEAVGLVLQASAVGADTLERDRFGLNQPWFDLKRESPSQVKLEHDSEVEGEARSASTSTDHALAIPEGGIFVLDMGEPVKIVDLARQMIRLAGLRPEQDIAIRFTGLRPGEKLFEELFHGGEQPAPTGFAGLLMARPRTADMRAVTAAIDAIAAAAQTGDAKAALAALARLVPEYGQPTAPAPALAVPGVAG